MARRRRKVVYLLGFMGSGKSTVGPRVAHELGWPFIDLDSTIEAAHGQTIREIFETAGEPSFRLLERAALSEASRAERTVIALGGGTFIQKENQELIREVGGTTIWLDCSLEELRRRCAGMDNRPLFRDPESFTQLFYQRLPYYQEADFRVAAEGVSPEEIVARVLRLPIF